MNLENFIPITQLSTHYKVELSFLSDLNEFGLIEFNTFEQTLFIHVDKIKDLEKIIRIHDELNINIEGIDVVLNLLQRIDELQSELNYIRNRLRIYEHDI